MVETVNNNDKTSDFIEKSLLVVDDDNPFRERLSRAMEKKGFVVSQAESVKSALETLKTKNQLLQLLI